MSKRNFQLEVDKSNGKDNEYKVERIQNSAVYAKKANKG